MTKSAKHYTTDKDLHRVRQNGTKALILSCLFAILTAFLLFGCSARKTDKSSFTDKEKEVFNVSGKEIDYSKLIEQNVSFDKGYILIREYKDGQILKESLEKKDKATTIKKVEVVKKYKIYNVYRKYNITKTITQKKTQKEAFSNRVYYFGLFLIFVFGLIVYFKNHILK